MAQCFRCCDILCCCKDGLNRCAAQRNVRGTWNATIAAAAALLCAVCSTVRLALASLPAVPVMPSVLPVTPTVPCCHRKQINSVLLLLCTAVCPAGDCSVVQGAWFELVLSQPSKLSRLSRLSGRAACCSGAHTSSWLGSQYPTHNNGANSVKNGASYVPSFDKYTKSCNTCVLCPCEIDPFTCCCMQAEELADYTPSTAAWVYE